ncbi:MAG: VPLPA-CTERM sorting domain-containing protein [Pseudomonadota bacterium]
MTIRSIILALGLAFGSATASYAASITITDQPSTTVFGTLTYTGADSDIVGYYGGSTSPLLAERYPSGSNGYESALLASAFGLDPGLNLGGSELPITGTGTTIAGNTYFTAKFGQSLALFHNTTSQSIDVSWIEGSSQDCKSGGFSPNACGGISHYKHVTIDPSVVPLPASGLLSLLGLAGFAALRRRKTA